MNHGDIWISESAARLVHGAALAACDDEDGDGWITDAAQLLERAAARAEGTFGPEGHPWAAEIAAAKEMVYATAEMGRAAGLAAGTRIFDHVYLSEDAQEGPKAFAEKRKPNWKGR